MKAVQLFTSRLLTVCEVACNARRGEESGEDEHSPIPCVAIPLRGCYAVDRQGQVVVADANTALLFDAGFAYRVDHPADDGDVSFVIACDPGAAADAFGNGTRQDADRRPFRSTHAHLPSRLQLRTRLFRRALTEGSVEPLAAEEEAFAIVASLAGTNARRTSSARVAAVERVKAFLGAHFRERISLGDAAHAGGMSPFWLAHTFPAVAGLTLHRYLVSLRLASALDAIAAGERELSRVAADAGFAHHSHFTKTFASTFGATPSVIRNYLSIR